MSHSFPRPPKYKLRVRKSKTGHGLFAIDEIPKNRFLIEYWGEIVSDAKADQIGGRYLFTLQNGKNIHGAHRKNIARYINHSCRPNCEARQVGNRIFIFSRKKIQAGDELTYDYGRAYCDHYIFRHGCRCDACIKKPSKDGKK